MRTVIESLLRIFALTRKELLAILKDPRSRSTLIIPPILQCLIYGYVATYDLTDVPYAVLDQDHSAASQELLSHFDGSGIFRRVANLRHPDDIKKMINEQHVIVAIQIGQNFERQIMASRPADVQVIADGRNSNTAATATGYVNTVIQSFNADWRAAHGLSDPPISVVSRTWYNPNLETRWTMIPSLIGVLTLLQTLLLTAMSVAREREQGTFDQLLVTPFRPPEIMAGKALPSIIVGMVQASVILTVGQLWFHIPFAGSFFVLYVGLVIFLLAAVGIGLLVSAIAATMQQAMLYSFVVMMPFALLSGLTTPISSMPQSVQMLTLLNPLRYAIDIARRIYLEGAGFEVLIPDLWPLALIATVTLTTSSWAFRHRLT
jgi:ABC-2 type transport system permease protein